MKNYLVGAVRPVNTTWGYWKTQEQECVALLGHQKYQSMYDISRASAKKFLKGEWEEIKFQAAVRDARMYQIAQWYVIKELWHKEPCNILAMGADTLFAMPVEIFDRYEHMMMFNYTDPKSHTEFPHYFNDDIRYFPATMSPSVWAIGESAMEGWFTHSEGNWAWGQLIHNYQFWSQGLSIDQVLDPTMAWQAFTDIPAAGKWNGCDISAAKILHFHGSRNADNRVAVMSALAQQLGLQI